MNQYRQGTIEFIQVTVTNVVDGTTSTITSGVQYCVTPAGQQPVTWVAPVTLGSDQGVMLAGTETPGRYAVWVQVTAPPETPILLASMFEVV